MKRWIKRTIWSTIITLAAILLLVAGTASYLLYMVFTPEKLTPIVEKAAAEYLDASLRFSSVELTIFSTFPNVGVRLQNGELISSPEKRDSLMQNDTIVRFRTVDIVVNPIDLLRDTTINIVRVELEEPTIYGYISPQGVANWDIVKPSADTTAVDTTTTTPYNASLQLRRIAISNGKITFDDRQSGLYTSLDSLNLNLRGDLSAARSDITTSLSFQRGILWHGGELLFSKISFSVKADATLDTTAHLLTVRQAEVELNRLRCATTGHISQDSIDIKLSLSVPSLATVMELIPPTILRRDIKLTTQGEVTLLGNIRGGYRNGATPISEASLKIADASARYKGLPYSIDLLSAEASARLDLSRQSASYLHIQRFRFKGASTDITLNLNLDDILRQPRVKSSIKGTVNLTELSQTLPLDPAVTIGGQLTTSLEGEFSIEQLRKKEYAGIRATGSVGFKEFKMADSRKEFNFSTSELNLLASNTKEGLLKVTGDIKELSCSQGQQFIGSLNKMAIAAEGIKTSDSSSYLKSELEYSSLHASAFSDTLELNSGLSRVEAEIFTTHSHLMIKSDTLTMRANKSLFNMAKAKMDFTLKNRELNGGVGFANLSLHSPLFPLAMSMPAIVVRVEDHNIKLSKAHFKVGESDLLVSGTIYHILETLKETKPLKVKANVSSSLVNLTEIIHALNTTSRNTQDKQPIQPPVTKNADSSSMELFTIPKNVSLDLETSFSKVLFGNLDLRDVDGKVTVSNGSAYLDNLGFSVLGARFATTARYEATSDSLAQTGIELLAKKIDIHSIIELIPSIDTLVPMLRSFEGVVNFGITARAELTQGFAFDLNKLRATVSLHGENLVLLDKETFAEISKMLMFKNKKRNVVDSIDVQMAIRNGEINIYPFLMQLDRYRVAVGGQHNMNNTFNYHISVLKSPIPFKLGVNVSGSLDDMKVRLGKTQYKFTNEPTFVRQINPDFRKMREQIIAEINKM